MSANPSQSLTFSSKKNRVTLYNGYLKPDAKAYLFILSVGFIKIATNYMRRFGKSKLFYLAAGGGRGKGGGCKRNLKFCVGGVRGFQILYRREGTAYFPPSLKIESRKRFLFLCLSSDISFASHPICNMGLRICFEPQLFQLKFDWWFPESILERNRYSKLAVTSNLFTECRYKKLTEILLKILYRSNLAEVTFL